MRGGGSHTQNSLARVMNCFWCQEESTELFCTQCCATAHTPCLAAYFQGKRKCPICTGDIIPSRRLDAANVALDATITEYGADHTNSIMRTIDVSIAMSQCGQHREKKMLLQPLTRLRRTAANGWLVSVAHLEHARACYALSDHAQAVSSLRPIWKLKTSNDRFDSLLVAEGSACTERTTTPPTHTYTRDRFTGLAD